MNFFLNSLKFETVSESEKEDDPFAKLNIEDEEQEDEPSEEVINNGSQPGTGYNSRKKSKRHIDVLPVNDLESHLKNYMKRKRKLSSVKAGSNNDNNIDDED